MKIGTIHGHTVIAALDQTTQYQPLPIRHTMMNDDRTVCLQTAWLPDEAERALIYAGVPIVVSILKPASEPSHPPITLSVGDK